MPRSPRALIWSGVGVLLLALLLVVAAIVVRGPLNPECASGCSLAARALLVLALPVAIWGGVLVAMGIVRAEPDAREG